MFKRRGERENHFFGKHRLWIAIATLMGTIIGAGILGIPYVVAKAGFLYGLLVIILLGIAFLFLNLFAGEIVLRTKGKHQLTGYAARYLGWKGKAAMAFSMVAGIYGALTAYLIGEGETLRSIFGYPAGVQAFASSLPLGTFFLDHFYTLLFFLTVSVIIYRGLKAAGKMELISIFLLALVIILAGVFSWNNLRPEHFTVFNPTFFFVPYGVILFAYIASASIPEVAEVLETEKKKIKKAIIIGSLIPIVIYVLFTVIIVGLVGVEQFEVLQPNQRIATVALSLYSSPYLGLLANFLAVLSMFTSFLTLGIALAEMYEYDYHLSRPAALWLTLSVPLLITLFDLSTFITVLGLTGALAGGLNGLLLVLMYWKAKALGNRRPEYVLGKLRLVGLLIIAMFSLGLLYQLWVLL